MIETNLSPAIASMIAQLSMPVQYTAIMHVSILSVNEQCAVTVQRIGK